MTNPNASDTWPDNSQTIGGIRFKEQPGSGEVSWGQIQQKGMRILRVRWKDCHDLAKHIFKMRSPDRFMPGWPNLRAVSARFVPINSGRQNMSHQYDKGSKSTPSSPGGTIRYDGVMTDGTTVVPGGGLVDVYIDYEVVQEDRIQIQFSANMESVPGAMFEFANAGGAPTGNIKLPIPIADIVTRFESRWLNKNETSAGSEEGSVHADADIFNVDKLKQHIGKTNQYLIYFPGAFQIEKNDIYPFKLGFEPGTLLFSSMELIPSNYFGVRQFIYQYHFKYKAGSKTTGQFNDWTTTTNGWNKAAKVGYANKYDDIQYKDTSTQPFEELDFAILFPGNSIDGVNAWKWEYRHTKSI